jgi:DNA mismatch endonuclease, patch repair protein
MNKSTRTKGRAGHRSLLKPIPLTEAIACKMKAQRRRDTPCEVALRKLLHASGFRYRVDVRPEPSIGRRADIVFARVKVAVFLDGCFWHACPEHVSWPDNNGTWWKQKLERTRSRDQETSKVLSDHGWLVLRFWEHANARTAAQRVARAIQRRRLQLNLE